MFREPLSTSNSQQTEQKNLRDLLLTYSISLFLWKPLIYGLKYRPTEMSKNEFLFLYASYLDCVKTQIRAVVRFTKKEGLRGNKLSISLSVLVVFN